MAQIQKQKVRLTDLLRDTIKDLRKTYNKRGDVLSKEVYSQLSELGIGKKTAEEAKKTLGIKSYRVMRRWYWSIENKSGESKGEVTHDGE